MRFLCVSEPMYAVQACGEEEKVKTCPAPTKLMCVQEAAGCIQMHVPSLQG